MLEPELVHERLRPLTREQYEKLIALGEFDDARVELLYGMLVDMSPQKGPHTNTTQRVAKLLERALGDRALIYSHSPLALGEHSEPEPDVAVVPNRDYHDEVPTTAYLVVEVADSSLRKDRRIKARLYAEFGIAEYWIVIVSQGVVERHRDPRPDDGAYGTITTHGKDDKIALVAFPDVEIALADVLR